MTAIRRRWTTDLRTKLSTCARKAHYATATQAMSAAGELVLRPYRCDRCGLFHLTSRTKGKWVTRRIA